MDDQMHQIGEVAEAVGLSLRTIRYYEEADLVPPSGRSSGGFRLYTDADIERLGLVKHMKPLDLQVPHLRRRRAFPTTRRPPSQHARRAESLQPPLREGAR